MNRDGPTRGLPAGRSQADEQGRRQRRWRFFQIMLAILYTGVFLDILTTSFGILLVGNRYEQNPLTLYLIERLTSVGLLMVMTVLIGVAYVSCRVVYHRMALRWTRIFDGILFVAATTRWLAVVAAVGYLLSRPRGLERLQILLAPPPMSISLPGPADMATLSVPLMTSICSVAMALVLVNFLMTVLRHVYHAESASGR